MLELLNFGYMTVCDVLRDLIPFVQFKKRENTHGGALLLVKLHAEVCNFTKSNTPPWVFFKFLKLYKWYQIEQHHIYIQNNVRHVIKYRR